jgi:WD40 repeat protein
MPGPTTLLYDVSDAVHPAVVCRVSNTFSHVLTGTSFEYLVPREDGSTAIVLHSLGSNNENVRATVKADIYHTSVGWYGSVAWLPGHDTVAYVAGGGTDSNGLGITDVWLATPTGRTKVYSYAVPGKDTFGRPGFPPPTLAFSPDGAYLAAGWSLSATSVRVFRLADQANVTPQLPQDFRFAVWSRTGDTLYLVTGNAVEQWTPGSVPAPLPNTPSWILGPNLSPDGELVAFTALTQSRDVRAYVYDLNHQTSRLLIDAPRSSVTFVDSTWVWYLEEKPCVQTNDNACFDPTQPDGNVLAFNLRTGQETQVVFAPGDLPASPPGYVNLGPGDLWPTT